jgi:isopentenyl diphosphate isomerase/L-lactate dehydrogenase-like FMN-dependent dehydrogenase
MEKQKPAKRAGDSNEITRQYFDSLLVEMRHIDAVLPSTRLDLYGETFDTPIMTAALSHLYVCENGMTEMARGARAANAVTWCGMGEDAELEEIVATGARTIKIIKPHADNKEVFRKIEHAERCGVMAVGMDIDHAFAGNGKYDIVMGLPMTSKSLSEIKEFIQATSLPFIIKGVLSEQDAKKACKPVPGRCCLSPSRHHGFCHPAANGPAQDRKSHRPQDTRFCRLRRDERNGCLQGAGAGGNSRIGWTGNHGPLGKSKAAGVAETIKQMTEELAGVMARTVLLISGVLTRE